MPGCSGCCEGSGAEACSVNHAPRQLLQTRARAARPVPQPVPAAKLPTRPNPVALAAGWRSDAPRLRTMLKALAQSDLLRGEQPSQGFKEVVPQISPVSSSHSVSLSVFGPARRTENVPPVLSEAWLYCTRPLILRARIGWQMDSHSWSGMVVRLSSRQIPAQAYRSPRRRGKALYVGTHIGSGSDLLPTSSGWDKTQDHRAVGHHVGDDVAGSAAGMHSHFKAMERGRKPTRSHGPNRLLPKGREGQRIPVEAILQSKAYLRVR